MSTKLLYKSVGWNAAIEEAESQLQKASKQRESVLLGVIATFREKIRRGEPWPGDGYTVTQKTGTAGESIPA